MRVADIVAHDARKGAPSARVRQADGVDLAQRRHRGIGADARPGLAQREPHVRLVHQEIERHRAPRPRGERDVPGRVRRVATERLADGREALAVEAIVARVERVRENDAVPAARRLDEI